MINNKKLTIAWIPSTKILADDMKKALFVD